MKIDFNGQEMVIKFDKVPKLLYFNENNIGCGQIFLDGVRRKGLQEIMIHARTKGWEISPLKYRIQYFDKGTREPQIIGNMKDEICIGVKILDFEEFEAFLACVTDLVEDERIPEDIRQEFTEKIIAAIPSKYKTEEEA